MSNTIHTLHDRNYLSPLVPRSNFNLGHIATLTFLVPLVYSYFQNYGLPSIFSSVNDYISPKKHDIAPSPSIVPDSISYAWQNMSWSTIALCGVLGAWGISHLYQRFWSRENVVNNNPQISPTIAPQVHIHMADPKNPQKKPISLTVDTNNNSILKKLLQK